MCNDEAVSILFRDPLLDAAREAAIIATHRMTAWADVLSPVSVSSKDGKNDLVTEADAEIEALVRHHMVSLRPEDAIVGEEGSDARSLADHPAGEEIQSILVRAAEAAQRTVASSASQLNAAASSAAVSSTVPPSAADPADLADHADHAGHADPADPMAPAEDPGRVEWHIDPIDGTVNFVRGIEHFCFSAGARLQSAAPEAPDDGWVAGLVAAPMLDRVWFARAGVAWVAPLSALTDPSTPVRPLTGSTAPTTGRVVATGFGYAEDRRAQQLAALGRVMAQFDDIRRCGSAAIDLCMAAEGRVNAYYERGLGVYDFAGGAYVAECAGRFVHRRADSFLREGTGASIAVPRPVTAPQASQAAPNALVSPELTVVADTRERFEFLLADG